LWFDVNIDYYKTSIYAYLFELQLWFDVNIDYYKTKAFFISAQARCGLM
jgi:hypothetical protein